MKCPLCKSRITIAPRITETQLAYMRKQFAVVLRRDGYSYRQICALVGWKSPRTAMIYTQHVKPKTKVAQLAKGTQ